MAYVPGSTKRYLFLIGILLLLAAIFAAPFVTHFLLRITFPVHTDTLTFWVSRVMIWFCLLLIFIYAKKIEKQKLLLYEENNFKFYIYILSVIAIFITLFAYLAVITQILIRAGFSKESVNQEKMLTVFRGNHPLIIFTCLTAGFVEELTFRGYLMPRLELLLKSPAVSIFLSSILFGLLHFGYGTFLQIVGPFFIGLVFAFYYWQFRNIKVIIFCHFAWDMMAIYVKV